MHIIQITRNFKHSIFKVIMAIGLFFISYLFLLTLAVALLAASGYAALFLVTTRINVFTGAVALGLVSLGIMFFVFLIKFIFSRHTDKSPYRVQISRKEQPELFQLINEVAKSVGTRRPRKVFLSHNVNACVFYNSSFWSLFFPVKKNLEIGLGLINSVNQAELRAILAHEFGHFSQRSMKLGSYVYTVNNVIYNLVHNYDGWDRALESWASAGGIFGAFALITSRMVQAVRYVLSKAYQLINVNYMGLSREMEFHADQIAAAVAGKDNMISALRRIEFCDMAFNQTLNNLGALANKQKIAANIYPCHQFELKTMGSYFHLDFENALPLISDKDLDVNTVKPRVIFKDQWASHPSRTDREQNILLIDQENADNNKSDCWRLFNRPEKVQEQLTSNLYAVDYGDVSQFNTINGDEYIAHQESENTKYNIDEFFKGFYSNRYLSKVDLKKLADETFNGNIEESINETYHQRTKLKFDKLQHDSNDLVTLNQIKEKEIDTKYFEFDHVKYHRRDVKKAIDLLEKEIKTLQEEIQSLDENTIALNLAIAGEVSKETRDLLVNKYHTFYLSQQYCDQHQEIINEINGFQYAIYNKPRWYDEELNELCRELSKVEQNYKNLLQAMNNDPLYNALSKDNQTLISYLKDNTSFIRLTSFDMENFNQLAGLIFETYDVIYEYLLSQAKDLTDLQLANYKLLALTDVVEIEER